MNAKYINFHKYATLVFLLIFLPIVTGCSLSNNCKSEKNYLDVVACEENQRIEALTNIISFGFLGYLGYLIVTNPTWFSRLAQSLSQQTNLLFEGQEKDKRVKAFNELLLLTGGYYDGKKHIFKEVRNQDKARVIELCQFLLENNNFEETAASLNLLATALEQQKEDTIKISKLRKTAEYQFTTGQSIKKLLEDAKLK